MASNNYNTEEKDDLFGSILSELKALGVKVPKVKKIKSIIPKQEMALSEKGCRLFGVSLCEQEWTTEEQHPLPKQTLSFVNLDSPDFVTPTEKVETIKEEKKKSVAHARRKSFVALLRRKKDRKRPENEIPIIVSEVHAKKLDSEDISSSENLKNLEAHPENSCNFSNLKVNSFNKTQKEYSNGLRNPKEARIRKLWNTSDDFLDKPVFFFFLDPSPNLDSKLNTEMKDLKDIPQKYRKLRSHLIQQKKNPLKCKEILFLLLQIPLQSLGQMDLQNTGVLHPHVGKLLVKESILEFLKQNPGNVQAKVSLYNIKDQTDSSDSSNVARNKHFLK